MTDPAFTDEEPFWNPEPTDPAPLTDACPSRYPLSGQPCTLTRCHDGQHTFLGKADKWVTWDDPAPLTDEELAAEARGHRAHRTPEGHHTFCARCSFAWPCSTSRLIAEVERLRATVEALSDPQRAAVLLGDWTAADFVEVERP